MFFCVSKDYKCCTQQYTLHSVKTKHNRIVKLCKELMLILTANQLNCHFANGVVFI